MDPDKQPDIVARSKPQFRLGQEAVEGAIAVKPKAPEPEPKATRVSQTASAMPEALNKPLIECYPEIADDKDEILLADVRRIWLGKVAIGFTGVLLIIILFAFTLAVPSLIKGLGFKDSLQFRAMIGILAIIVAFMIAIGTLILLWIYRQSHMLITNENVIEVKQMNLFSKKVSHLNMINVEDVTVIKRGIFQTAFNYGTLSIETAGEKDNFSFPYTPSPDIYRRLVINAHEDAIDRIGRLGSGQRVEIANNG